jgi:hypothetical protein
LPVNFSEPSSRWRSRQRWKPSGGIWNTKPSDSGWRSWTCGRRATSGASACRGLRGAAVSAPVPVNAVPDFAGLADDLQAAWNAPAVTTRARQRLLRVLIVNIIADVDEAAHEVKAAHRPRLRHPPYTTAPRRPGSGSRAVAWDAQVDSAGTRLPGGILHLLDTGSA